ncbi:MAG: DoxX family protein [Pirellulaceae bacterium]|nr:DoxX family protein [Pirellulaceae bacterium]
MKSQSTTKSIIGWVLTGLLALFLIGVSGIPKFIDFPGKTEMFAKLGITSELSTYLGVLEIVLALLFVIPRTGFLGAVLLTGYLGGATWAHVRIGDPFWFPVLMGIMIWVVLGLRQPEIFGLAFGKSQPSNSKEER